jgi:hypothetical protein
MYKGEHGVYSDKAKVTAISEIYELYTSKVGERERGHPSSPWISGKQIKIEEKKEIY